MEALAVFGGSPCASSSYLFRSADRSSSGSSLSHACSQKLNLHRNLSSLQQPFRLFSYSLCRPHAPTRNHHKRSIFLPHLVASMEEVEETCIMIKPDKSYQTLFHYGTLDGPGRRQLLAMGTTVGSWVLLSNHNYISFAAETKKGFLAVVDKKDGYSFLYPFGWQEVVIEGQDKVFKDVIEPLESVSVNLIPTGKQDIRDLGPPQEVAETLIKKVLAPPSQKTKLVEAAEHDVDGTAYYTFEFTAQAPNFTRHALSAICIGNGKFYTLTTGANERRWEKMKDKLHAVIDSFKIFNV